MASNRVWPSRGETGRAACPHAAADTERENARFSDCETKRGRGRKNAMDKRIILTMTMACAGLLSLADEYYIQWNSISDGAPGNLLSWKVFQRVEQETGGALISPYTNCSAVVRRNGVSIATVNVVSSTSYYRDLNVVVGSTNTYTIAAMGVESNESEKICELSYEMEVSPVASMSFSVDGGTKTTTISGTQTQWSKRAGYTYSSLNWNSRSSAQGSWIALKKSGDELQVTAKRLTSGTARSAIINITLGGYIIAQISVLQGDASACTDVTVTDVNGRQINIEGWWFDKYPTLATTYGSNEDAAMSDAANGMKVWLCQHIDDTVSVVLNKPEHGVRPAILFSNNPRVRKT